MKRPSRQAGYSLVDMLVALALFGFVLLAIYQLYGSTFALSRGINSQLATQQDVRLVLDRVARALHETSTAYGRLRVYSQEAGCSAGYEGCLGFVTAREGNCTGAFRLVGGAPDWQATLYLWRDVASNELRLRCDPTTTFPVAAWPPPAVGPYSVVGTRIVAIAITLEPAGSPHPSAVAIALREQSETSSRRTPTPFFSETIFLPQNR